MGEVYRARDSRLGRDVAVKVLPPAFSADTDRLQRFEQEARAAAALNHPNILAVYDVGTHDGAPYIVSELLDGETMRERLSQTQTGLPVRKATEYAAQIAHGLAAAHEKGIAHRDLKPENIFITSDGRVKILDLGLAKLTQKEDPFGSATNVPTTPRFETQPGMLLGTMGYMAPEQVRGQAADHRADIFSFGVILYEMLSGRRAFHGATTADTITAILKGDPPDLPVVEHHIPPALERIVGRCLEKSAAARFQNASDLAFALESLSSQSDRTEIAGVVAAAPSRRSREGMPWSVAALLIAALALAGVVAVGHLREAPAPADAVQFQIAAPENTLQSALVPVISPDGRQLAFIASRGGAMLWVRPLAAREARPLPGTEGAASPFWSPDSRFIGFFAGGKLKKIQISGGPPIVLCDAQSGRGGTWSTNNTIVFAPVHNGILQKVPSAGGTPTPVTILDKSESAHRWPWFLPNDQHFVYLAVTSGGQVPGVLRLGSLESSETTTLVPAGSNAAYGSGHLMFVRGDTLLALPFDPERLQILGEAFPVADALTPVALTLRAAFSVSLTGVLTYGRSIYQSSQLTWFDRAGKSLGKVGDPGNHQNLALSPDERRLAVSMVTGSPQNIDVWVIDLARDATPSRLTFDPAPEWDPAWSPDGSWVAFTSSRTGTLRLYRHASSGSGQDEPLMESDLGASGPDWSSDGRSLVYSPGPTGALDLFVLPLPGREPVAFLQTPFSEGDAALSPDGHWIAYASNESGRQQVYVQPFPKGSGKYLISRDGGTEPRWRGDGKELFFLALDGTMMSAGIDVTKGFQATVLHALFQTGLPSLVNNHPYVVTRDGARFLIPVYERTVTAPISVTLNWPAAIQK
jgi:Tol biopolymer transport system component